MIPRVLQGYDYDPGTGIGEQRYFWVIQPTTIPVRTDLLNQGSDTPITEGFTSPNYFASGGYLCYGAALASGGDPYDINDWTGLTGTVYMVPTFAVTEVYVDEKEATDGTSGTSGTSGEAGTSGSSGTSGASSPLDTYGDMVTSISLDGAMPYSLRIINVSGTTYAIVWQDAGGTTRKTVYTWDSGEVM